MEKGIKQEQPVQELDDEKIETVSGGGRFNTDNKDKGNWIKGITQQN